MYGSGHPFGLISQKSLVRIQPPHPITNVNMNSLDFKTQQVANSILELLELAHTQGRKITWRTIFTFLQYPPESWEDDEDIDDIIEIKSESDLVLLKAMVSSKFATKH